MLGFGRRSFARRARAQVRAPFIATNLKGCVVWLTAARGLLAADIAGNAISTWADQSGQGNTPTQATGANKPTYSAAGGPNGRPVVTFSGNQWLALGSAPVSANNFTLIAVFKITGASQLMFSVGDGSTGVAVGTLSSRAVNCNGVATDSDGAFTSNYEVWTVTSSSAPLQALRVNGAAQSLSPNTTTTIAASAHFVIGAQTTVPNFPVTGGLAEAAFYNRVLGTAEILEAEAALATQYGIYKA